MALPVDAVIAWNTAVRPLQAEVLPNVVFDATDADLGEMMVNVQAMRADLYVARCWRALRGASFQLLRTKHWLAQQPLLRRRRRSRRGWPPPSREAASHALSRNCLLSFLRDQLIEFRIPQFKEAY